MKLAYADPPYPGQAYQYRDHPDYAGEVDHAQLIDRLEAGFDGWVLHTSATPTAIATLAPLVLKTGARWCSGPASGSWRRRDHPDPSRHPAGPPHPRRPGDLARLRR